MRVLYKPFAIVAGMIGSRVGRNVFKSLWAKVDDADPPAVLKAEASTGKVIGAAALEAATLAATGAAASRLTAKLFHYLTGVWPEKPEKEKDETSGAPGE